MNTVTSLRHLPPPSIRRSRYKGEKNETPPPSTPPRLFCELCYLSGLRLEPSRGLRYASHSLVALIVCCTDNMIWSQPRRLSTAAPPPKPGPGTHNPEDSKNTALYVGAAAVGLGGLYYYYAYATLEPQARPDAERVKQKSHELGDAAKDSAHNKLQQGQNKVDEYRVRTV